MSAPPRPGNLQSLLQVSAPHCLCFDCLLRVTHRDVSLCSEMDGDTMEGEASVWSGLVLTQSPLVLILPSFISERWEDALLR